MHWYAYEEGSELWVLQFQPGQAVGRFPSPSRHMAHVVWPSCKAKVHLIDTERLLPLVFQTERTWELVAPKRRTWVLDPGRIGSVEAQHPPQPALLSDRGEGGWTLRLAGRTYRIPESDREFLTLREMQDPCVVEGDGKCTHLSEYAQTRNLFYLKGAGLGLGRDSPRPRPNRLPLPQVTLRRCSRGSWRKMG